MLKALTNEMLLAAVIGEMVEPEEVADACFAILDAMPERPDSGWIDAGVETVSDTCGAPGPDAEIAALRQREAELEAALSEAADNMEGWGAYADPYFKEKHDLAGDLRRARALLGEEG
jgi:hypothetical protein